MRISILIAFGLAVFGCRSRVQEPILDSPPPLSRVIPDAHATVDSSSQLLVLPTSLDEASLELRSLVHSVQTWLASAPWSDWQITLDGPHRKSRATWLARDFNAPIFLRADRIEEAWLQRSEPLHLGFFVVHFKNCKSLTQALAGIAKTKRQNFMIPILTIFRTQVKNHNLVFIFSETPLHTQVTALFQSLDTILGPDTPCTD